MPRFQPGDYVKAEFKDDVTGESERMWVVVDSCDNEEGFPRLSAGEQRLTAPARQQTGLLPGKRYHLEA